MPARDLSLIAPSATRVVIFVSRTSIARPTKEKRDPLSSAPFTLTTTITITITVMIMIKQKRKTGAQDFTYHANELKGREGADS